MSNIVMPSNFIDFQHASKEKVPAADEEISSWVETVLIAENNLSELTLRFVDTDEIHALNKTYRKKDAPTNVLAFPLTNLPKEINLPMPFIGDVIICPAVLQKECIELNKTYLDHFAHIVIHGVLHLLGFDHIKDSDAKIMHAREAKFLQQLGFAPPYTIEDSEIE